MSDEPQKIQDDGSGQRYFTELYIVFVEVVERKYGYYAEIAQNIQEVVLCEHGQDFEGDQAKDQNKHYLQGCTFLLPSRILSKDLTNYLTFIR